MPTRWPCPRSTMRGSSASRLATAPSTLIAIVGAQSAHPRTTARRELPTPALAITRSMPPSSSSRRRSASTVASGSETSSGSTRARPPAARIDAATSSSSSRLRADRTTSVPRAASCRASSAPIPLDAPEIQAILDPRPMRDLYRTLPRRSSARPQSRRRRRTRARSRGSRGPTRPDASVARLGAALRQRVEHLLAGVDAALAGLAGDAAVLVLVLVLRAFVRAAPARFDAGLAGRTPEVGLRVGLARDEPARRRAEIRAVEIQADAFAQLGHVLLGQAGVRADRRHLLRLEAGFDRRAHLVEVG